MTFDISYNSILQILLFLVTLISLIIPLGAYMAAIYSGNTPRILGFIKPVEQFIYRLCAIKAEESMDWKTYSINLLVFSFLGFVLLFLMVLLQGYLPLNPENLPGVSLDLAFNIAASFVTNTNWQSYSGETSLSYFSQVFGVILQNFISASVGMSVLVALARGIKNKITNNIGNFWTDLVRSTLYILIPLSIILAIALVATGVVQTFSSHKEVKLIEAQTYKNQDGTEITQTTQKIAIGPVAALVAIKQLGTNGGGFFNANSAHPFENPNIVSNFLQLLAILLIPASLCYSFGLLVGDKRQGIAILTAMFIIFMPLLFLSLASEQAGNPYFDKTIVDQTYSDNSPGGNMEGKEVRFGITNSVLWQSATTAASNGSVNSMHDSYTAIGGLVSLAFMQLGEVVFGGVGSGLYGMLIFVIFTVFIAGLMVGRTPEYLGKKIGAFEIKMSCIAILIPSALVLLTAALALSTKAGVAGIQEPGPHGLSEVLYATTSAGMNNGSAFAGISANSPFYNIILGIVMLLSRFMVIVPVLAIAGSLANKNYTPVSNGTLPTHNLLFIILLVFIVIMIGLLTFVPALMIGPVAEFLL